MSTTQITKDPTQLSMTVTAEYDDASKDSRVRVEEKLLFARGGKLHCRGCGKPVVRDTPSSIFQQLEQLGETRIVITFPVPIPKNFSEKEIEELLQRSNLRNQADVARDLAEKVRPSDLVDIIEGSDARLTVVPAICTGSSVWSFTSSRFTVRNAAARQVDAGVAFVNALPVFIASDPEWAAKFEEAGVPIVGDDIKSQVGATITHRVMAKLFEDRGVALDRTYQLNVGGNMDFKNMLERERLESKKISKTQSVTSQIDRDMGQGNVHIGPSDHVPWLSDRKWAYVRLEGRAFGDVPLNLEYKLEVWDSPNSAGIIIDAVRAAKIAKDRGIGGPIIPASAYLMKSPPVQIEDTEGRLLLEKFIAGE